VPEIVIYMLVALSAYFLGSIPFGFLVARAKGIDIRNVGSGNIGATNAMRVLGKPAGILVLVLDALKGWLACCLGQAIYAHFAHRFIPFEVSNFTDYPTESAVMLARFATVGGVCAVLGHNYTCWLKFKGGKGIATTAGVFLALAPEALLIALVVFILAVALTRYMSVGSIAGAVALPAAVWIMTPHDIFLGVVTTALGVMAIYKHKSNIKRLMAGTENRLGKKAEDAK
jgi:acyl phosphate:glycerol-3-phosphate acyltransferase